MYNYQKELKQVATAMDETLKAYFEDEEIVESPMIDAFLALRDCNDRAVIETANIMLDALETIHDFKYIRNYLCNDLEETLALCDKEDIEAYEEYAFVLFNISDIELSRLWDDLQPYDMNEGCWAQHWFV